MQFSEQDAQEVGEAIGIDWDAVDFSPEDLAIGMTVELEHGTAVPETNVTDDDPEATAKIAWAHLQESSAYYELLAEMEQEAGRERDAYMRTVDPSGKAPDRTISDSLRKYLNDYLGKLNKAVEQGKDANQAFREIRPDLSRVSIDQLISLLWENQQVGRRMPKKVPAYQDLYTILERELERYIWEQAVQQWGRQETRREPAPREPARDETETVPGKRASMVRYRGHQYRRIA